MVVSTYRRTSAADVTSAWTTHGSPPASSTAFRDVSSAPSEMSTSATRAPSDTRRRAVARPMPPPAPVMTATLPVNRLTSAYPEERAGVVDQEPRARRDIQRERLERPDGIARAHAERVVTPQHDALVSHRVQHEPERTRR